MLRTIEFDCRSITGRNLRRLQTDKMLCEKYNLEKNDRWKINFVKEMIDIKSGKKRCNLSFKEIDAILENVCCT